MAREIEKRDKRMDTTERETEEKLTKTQTTMAAGRQWPEGKELIYDTSSREF